MNNIKEEFIKLEEFKQSIKDRRKQLMKIVEIQLFEGDVINKNTTLDMLRDLEMILGEIGCFIEDEANGERDKFSYITNDKCFE